MKLRTALLPFIAVTLLPTTTQAYSPIHQAIENRFKSAQEPYALEADWVTPTTFKIGSTRSKTNHPEFARYTCEKIQESGLHHPQLTVKIINLPKLMATGVMEDLAVQNCDPS